MWLLIEEGRTGSAETTLRQFILVGENKLCWERTQEEDEFHVRGFSLHRMRTNKLGNNIRNHLILFRSMIMEEVK